MLEQLQPREHEPRTAHQRLEERELLRRELDLDIPAPDLPRRRVESQIPDLDDSRPLRDASARERAQPSVQLRERERLREIVVGAGVESGDAILDASARSQHEHGRPDSVLAPGATHAHSVEARQHQVEHDRVVLDRLSHPEGVVARSRHVDRVSVLAQAADEKAGHLELVLDDEKTHVHILPAKMRRR